MTPFIPGLKLAEEFFNEAVKPILDINFPNLKYSAALIGSGSEVLGFDTPQSTDHHWGPKSQIFLTSQDYEKYKDEIKEILSLKLPYDFKGYSTNFGKPDTFGVQLLEKINSGSINHLVYVINIDEYFKKNLGFTSNDLRGWLNVSEQKLLEVTSGKVFYDGLNLLNKKREEYSYYPKDVWLFRMASLWKKINDEEAFIGRTGDLEDELGSKIIASRITDHLIHLCFLIERRYTPYNKWLGTAFTKLDSFKKLSPVFENVLSAESWKEREKYLSKAYETIAQLHNELKVTRFINPKVSNFYNRPYLLIHADRFFKAIKEEIKDEEIKKII